MTRPNRCHFRRGRIIASFGWREQSLTLPATTALDQVTWPKRFVTGLATLQAHAVGRRTDLRRLPLLLAGVTLPKRRRVTCCCDLSLVSCMADVCGSERERFWRELISGYDRRIRAYCHRTRCDPEEVNQIVWDLWQEATTHESALERAEDRWTVLLGLLRRLCAQRVSEMRRECRLPEFEVDVQVLSPGEESGDPRDPSDLILHRLAELPYQQRIAVDFRFRWGMPYWAIAAALDTAEATARVHVARGLRALRNNSLDAPPRRN
jgi:DNA-directed RNA polymerase specialized sigma24 family protein